MHPRQALAKAVMAGNSQRNRGVHLPAGALGCTPHRFVPAAYISRSRQRDSSHTRADIYRHMPCPLAAASSAVEDSAPAPVDAPPAIGLVVDTERAETPQSARASSLRGGDEH